MNYPDVHKIFPAKSPNTFTFPNSPLHEAYKDTNLSLLTDDLKNIRIVVNEYLILGGYYGIRPRAETEMEKLENDAKELIALLRKEYPE